MTVETETRIELRASSLSGAPDCFRRWAAGNRTLTPLLKRHGFYVSERGDNIGNLVGSACHEGVGAYLQAKIDGYTADPYKAAIGKWDAITEKYTPQTLPIDKETPDEDVAKKQITRMVETYMSHAVTLKPKRLEFKLEAKLDPIKPYVMTGHPDIYEENGDFRDMKFGKNHGEHRGQLGSYRLMARSNGMETGRLFVDWVKRGSLKSAQQPLVIEEYDAAASESAAYYMAEDLMRQIEKFKETGDPWAFLPNPNSNLCSRRWCNAWGTEFCDMGRPE